MPNFRELQAQGTSFSKAYLNYMGSETVIAHNVLMSGQTPRNMGWVDEAYRDRKGLLSSDTNQMWITGELSYDQYGTLIQDKGYPKLADYLQEAQPGKKFIVVGQKGYAVESAAAESACDTFSGAGTDIAVRFGSRSANNPSRPVPDRPRRAVPLPDGRQRAVVPHGPVRTLLRQLRQLQHLRHECSPSRPGSTRLTATGSCRATTTRTSVATSGSPTRRWP